LQSGMPPDQVVRFGPFEADLRTQEFRKHGLKVKLQDQPFQILAILLEQPGQVIAREQLRQKLWPEGTYVEFEHGLNAAMQRLRQALGDSADDPHFIQTLPRKGYRFIARVERPGEEPAEQPKLQQEMLPISGSDWRRGLTWLVAAALTLPIIAAVLGWAVYTRMTGRPTDSETRVIPLTSYLGEETHPSFSPDGTHVAFCWNGEKQDNFDIYVKVLDAGPPLRLTNNPADEFGPAWSPDGQSIAFYRSRKDLSGIYSVSAVGGSERKLADLAVAPRFDRLSWSPDGKFLAFVDRDLQKGGSYVFLLSIETGAKRMLEGPASELQDQHSPVFSPDGQTIAFLQGTLALPDIRLRPVAGGASRSLTRTFGDTRAALAWTPDSREIVFSSFQDGQPGLWRIPVSGGSPQRVGRAGENAFAPSISRQGHLVFERFAYSGIIRRVELRGEGRRDDRFIVSTTFDDNPQYSPDGTRIAFASWRSGSMQVWVCDSEGRNPVQLTFMGTDTSWISWSPDGRQLAFNSDARGQWSLYTIAVEGGPVHLLTRDQAHESRPSWSPDGRWIYYNSDRSGAFQVWKVPSSGGPPIQVTKHGGFGPVVSRDGRFVYYANGPKGPSVWRVPADGGDETPILEDVRAYLGRWTVVSNGIYFVDTESRAIKFSGFETRRITDVLQLETTATDAPLSVSPDGRYLLYAFTDRNNGDLMLAKNFR
jgi:Tol biopolymer transport system component/DNA-binding winged helix-turn-helix (wHTH) protein